MTKVFIGLFISLFFTGCATIFTGSKQAFYIKSSIDSSHISVVDVEGIEVFKGKSPAAVRLKSGAGYFRKAGYTVTITAPGHDPKTFPIEYKMNGWYFANIFIGGALGMVVVDPLTGAMWKPKTKEVYASF